MSFERPLRGQCLCGRNRYIIFPKHAIEPPRVLFNQRGNFGTPPSHTCRCNVLVTPDYEVIDR